MNTLWDGSALPAYQRLEEHLIADVAVVGGGMAGILTALWIRPMSMRCPMILALRFITGSTLPATVPQYGMNAIRRE